MSSGLISPEDYYASRGSQAPSNSLQQNPGRSWPQGYAPGSGRFQSGGHKSSGGVKKKGGTTNQYIATKYCQYLDQLAILFCIPEKGKKGNAFLHLENFTSVQQLALFEPSIEIITQQLKPNRLIHFLECQT